MARTIRSSQHHRCDSALATLVQRTSGPCKMEEQLTTGPTQVPRMRHPSCATRVAVSFPVRSGRRRGRLGMVQRMRPAGDDRELMGVPS